LREPIDAIAAVAARSGFPLAQRLKLDPAAPFLPDIAAGFSFIKICSEQIAKSRGFTDSRCLRMDVGCPCTAPLTGIVRSGCGNQNTRKQRTRMAYSRLRTLIMALGPRAFKSLPDGVGLKTAIQAANEGLVEADGEFSATSKYRLTAAGIAKKTLYGGPTKQRSTYPVQS